MSKTVEVPGFGPVEFPDGMSDEDIAIAIKKNIGAQSNEQKGFGLDTFSAPSPFRMAQIAGEKEGGFGTGAPKDAYDAGGWVTDKMAGILGEKPAALAGYGTNVLLQALPSMITSGRVAEEPLSSVFKPWPAKQLMQSAIKPGLADRLSKNSDRAIETMLQQNIPTTRGGIDSLMPKISELNSQVDDAIANSTGKVNVVRVGERLRKPWEMARNQVNPNADMNAVSGAWDEFRNSPLVFGRTEIPAKTAQTIKQGTYKALGSKSYGELGSASTEAQKALARGLREETIKAVPAIKAPLEKEAELMNVREVAMNRVLQEANKNPMGLGALRMDSPMSSMAFMADRSGALKGMLARTLFRMGVPQNFIPGILAASSAKQTNKER